MKNASKLGAARLAREGAIMCTGIRFTDAQGNLYFGRNLDWGCGYGEGVIKLPAGFTRPLAFTEQNAPARAAGAVYAAAPQNAPAIIGMGITHDGMPLMFDCANEHGLCAAGLNFPGFAQYESAPVPGKTNIAVYEFPWWICASFQTVAQVRAVLENVALVGVAPSPELGVSMLHWFISDATECITVEYNSAQGGMRIYTNTAEVLTNQPTFPWHIENLRNYINVAPAVPADTSWDKTPLSAYGAGFGMRGLPGDYTSPSRFVRAAYHNAHYPAQSAEAENITRAFKTLGAVSMIKGGSIMTNGQTEYTVYTGVFSQKTKTYYHTTYDNPTIQSTSL